MNVSVIGRKSMHLAVFALFAVMILLTGCATTGRPTAYEKPKVLPSSMPPICSQPWVKAEDKDEWVCPQAPAPQQQVAASQGHSTATVVAVGVVGLAAGLLLGQPNHRGYGYGVCYDNIGAYHC